jgi:hypothetical protein
LVNPAQLAEEAAAMLVIPRPPGATVKPMVRFKDGRTGGIVGMPLWLWISRDTWRSPKRVHLEAGPIWVDVTAEPVGQTWTFGDGRSVTCRGRGTEYRAGMNGVTGSPDCGYKYTRTSKNQSNDAYTIRATVHWRITWVGSGNSAGELPPFPVTTTIPYVVREARAELVAP